MAARTGKASSHDVSLGRAAQPDRSADGAEDAQDVMAEAPEATSGELPGADYLLDPAERRSQQLITLFLRLVPGQIEQLLGAVHAQDREQIRLCSHKLKGGCVSLGARAMADLCQAIQHGVEAGDTSQVELQAQRVAQLFAPTAQLLERELARSS